MALQRLHSAFVLGYHGCDAGVAEQLLQGASFRQSENSYDWLGHGIYFWEANPKRGLEYARELKARGSRPKIRAPAVIGAVIDLGLCLDMTASASIEQVRIAYESVAAATAQNGISLPANSDDGLRRHLDCFVIEALHGIRKGAGELPLDSLKGVFLEGVPIYSKSGFYEKTHIQICVRNPECIKGVFRVPDRFLS